MDATTTDEVVIFQPEFIEFGGEERVILALSEGFSQGLGDRLKHESNRTSSRNPFPACPPKKAWARNDELDRPEITPDPKNHDAVPTRY